MGSAADHQMVTVTLFSDASLALGSALEFPLSPNTEFVITRCPYKIHLSSHIIIWSQNSLLFLRTVREECTSKWFFWFVVSSWGTHLLSFFTFLICFKCQLTVERPTLRSSATSGVTSDQLRWPSQLVAVNFWQPVTVLLIFKSLSSSAKLEPPLLYIH